MTKTCRSNAKIIINEIPPSLNKFAGRENTWEYRAEKARWKSIVCMASKWNKQPMKKAVVTITYFFGDKRRRDPDNYAGKMILDGLTAAGVIEDDSFSNIRLVLAGQIDKDSPRTEICVQEVQDVQGNTV